MAATLADIQTKLTELTAKVAEQTTIERSVETLLNGLSAQNADLRAQIAALIAGGGSIDPSALQPILDALNATEAALVSNTDKLKAAVIANTP